MLFVLALALFDAQNVRTAAKRSAHVDVVL